MKSWFNAISEHVSLMLNLAALLMVVLGSVEVLLSLVRDSGVAQKVVAPAGNYQQSLPQSRTYHLLRLRLEAGQDLVPEISGHRLMVTVRMMKQDAEGRLKPFHEDTSFELTLCT